MPCHAPRFTARLSILATAAALALGTGHAAVNTTGAVFTGPVPAVLGPGDTLLPTIGVWVGGAAGTGGLTVDGGSFLQLARLSFGSGGGIANGTGLITGAGTRVHLAGDGFSNSQAERLVVGDWGVGQLTVNGGALLDTRLNGAPCLQAFHFCDSFVGGAAGDTAVLNIDGVGTRVNIGQTLFIAQPGLAVQQFDGYNYGVPGGTTRGTVNVTGGAVLSTDRAQVGPRHWSALATGHERNLAEVNVSGAGSRWVLTGGQVVDNSNGAVSTAGASFITANDRNAWATVNVTGGGVVEVQGSSAVYNFINLTTAGNGGGRTDMTVSGAGSKVLFTSQNGVLNVGRSSQGTAHLQVVEGGAIEGMFYLSVGRDGAKGDLLIDGAASRVLVNGTATAAANGITNTGVIDIGRGGGTGTVWVTGGGQLLLQANQALGAGTQLNVGRDAASAGALNIAGDGSFVKLSSVSVLPGGGAGEALNPVMRVGRDGNGTLQITGGGKLWLDGQAVSTVAQSRGTELYIGGVNDTAAGGKGIASVSGAGSEIKLTGNDTFVGVGVGPGAFGQLTVAAGASVGATGMNVGRSGGVGVLAVDAATLNFAGQQTGNVQSGAFLSIGRSGGIGVASFTNGSVVTLSNMGSAGASLSLGGTSVGPLGDGSLTVSGGSRVVVQAAPGQATLSVARDGSGLMRVKGASTVDVGDGNVFVGRLKGSDGTLLVSEGSTINAGWVGVGRNKTATGDADGGTGTFVLTGSTLNAQTIVIGTNGFLGGSGKINGDVINHGIFSPGNSPGTMEIAGSFSAGLGSRLVLEVEDDGHGGFNTDHLIFGDGKALDMAGLAVQFRFLGLTDPNAFQASGGFDIRSFFQLRAADASLGALDPQALAQAQFSAEAEAFQISSFSFDVANGASFTAVPLTPVPEPGAAGLLLAGLLVLGWRKRGLPA